MLLYSSVFYNGYHDRHSSPIVPAITFQGLLDMHHPHGMVVENHGILPTWQPISRPSLAPDSLRVKVGACALNFADLLMIEGTYQDTPPLPFVPGMEISGRVIEAGSNTKGFAPGQRVTSFCGHGGLAEELVVDANRCMTIPESMDDTTAAAFPIAYGTSHLGLTRRARLRAGETLLVLGAAGGVGLTAVEIGKAIGARVIAVARGEAKQAAARAAGADETIDARTEDLRGALKEQGPIHVVYDPVGGASGEAALRCLAPEGRYLVIGFASGDVPVIRANHLLVKNIDVIGFYWGGYRSFAPAHLTGSLAELMQWHSEGRIRPHISHVLPINQLADGLELLRSRKATGKVVLTL